MTRTSSAHRLVSGCAAAILAAFTAPNVASAAPTKDQCIDANTQAQDFRRDGKLLSARQALRLCASESCPRIVRADCTQRLDELEAAIPSVTFEAKDGAGHDLSAVIVTMDDKPLADHLDGTPIEVDPGEHIFSFRTADLSPTTLRFVIRQGDRGRRESITVGPPPAAKPPTQAGAPESSDAPHSGAPAAANDQTPPAAADAGNSRAVWGWTAVGVGAAGLALGGISAALAISKKNMIDGAYDCQNNRCNPRESGLVDNYNQFRTVSSIGFIAGGVFAATGIVLLLTTPHRSEASAALWVGPGSAGFIGKFQ